MARHEHLPIYKPTLDMTVHFEKLVAGFSRYHKYTLGMELREGKAASRRFSKRLAGLDDFAVVGAQPSGACNCSRWWTRSRMTSSATR